MPKRKIIDLEVDYIDSRSITKKELDEISTYIRSRKFKTTSRISANRAQKKNLPIYS